MRDNAALREAVDAGAGAVLEPCWLGEGEHNLNYRFQVPGGRAFVLRVNVAPQPFHANQVAYEFAALTALEPSGCTPEPVYLDDSPAAPGKGALVESFCKGRELDFDNLRPGDLSCAARLMADVHAVAVAADCPLHRPADPLRELFEECLQRYEVYRASAFEEPRVTKWAERFIAAAERAVRTPCSSADCSHIVNTETLPSHFLIAGSAAMSEAPVGRVAGIGAPAAGGEAHAGQGGALIDWERPIIGEVAQDVAYFTSPTTTFWDSDYLFPGSDVGAFVEEYWRAVGGRFARGGFDGRFLAWRAMTALRSVTWCCRALVQYRLPGAHKTEKTAAKLPVYLSDDFMSLLAEECFGLRA